MDYIWTWTSAVLDVFGLVFITVSSNIGRFWTGLGHPRGGPKSVDFKKAQLK